MSRNQNSIGTLIFSKDPNVSRSIKAKEFWKFFNSCNIFSPANGSSFVDSGQDTLLDSRDSMSDYVFRDRIWFNTLRILQQLGLDKIPIKVTSKKFDCYSCCLGLTKECISFEPRDLIETPYEELNAAMESFDRSKILE